MAATQGLSDGRNTQLLVVPVLGRQLLHRLNYSRAKAMVLNHGCSLESAEEPKKLMPNISHLIVLGCKLGVRNLKLVVVVGGLF